MHDAPRTDRAGSSPRGEGGDDRADWVTLAEAARVARRHVSSVKNLALAGTIRTRWVPGERVRYSRADARRIADGARHGGGGKVLAGAIPANTVGPTARIS